MNSTVLTETLSTPARWNWQQKLGAALFRKYLKRWKEGAVEVEFPDGSQYSVAPEAGTRPSKMVIRDPRFFQEILFEGDVGFGRSYSLGYWNSPDTVKLLSDFTRNFRYGSDDGYGLTFLGDLWLKWQHRFRKNTREGSRRNIASHYDLGNELYTRFLDPNLVYSSALFRTGEESLEEAQIAKFENLIEMADVKAGDHVLEIGTGWGQLAIMLARDKGCRVTSLTLSREQKKIAEGRIRELGLENKITVHLMDYRDITGTFDAVVSVEMIEAVGHEFLAGYFKKCREVLKPGGNLAIQAITMPDKEYPRYRKSCDFIQKYIFPGACVPSLKVLGEVSKKEKLHTTHLSDNMALDYARTLKLWREAFNQNWSQIKAHGYDSYFKRMWNYYLEYCEAGFCTGYLGTYQMRFHKAAL